MPTPPDLFSAPNAKTIGHGNAQLLADLCEPGITRAELRNRAKAGKYPGLWKGSAAWISFRGLK